MNNLLIISDTFTQLSTSMDSIDIVINNAGILDEKRWTKEVAVNIVSEIK